MATNISGFVVARNAIKFNYPIEACVSSLRPFCDEIILAYDPTTEDGTHEVAIDLKQSFDITLFSSVWNMDNMVKGFEIGHQTQLAQEQCSNSTEWRLSVQLDEAFHEDDREKIIELVKSAPPDLTGLDVNRVCFYGNLHTIRRDWCVQITRIFRKNTHTFEGFDGQNCLPIGTVRHDFTGLWLFHYSRVGDPNAISKRIRNIDSFFHAEENLPKEEDLLPYDFVTREFDCFSSTENPRHVGSELLRYEGTHPPSFQNIYNQYK